MSTRPETPRPMPGPPANWDPAAVGPVRALHPRPVIMSHPIRAAVRVDALHLGTQTAAELAAAKIRAAVRAQIEDALPGITPEDAAQLLKVTERELQVTTRPDGSVSMTIAFNVATRAALNGGDA